MPYSQRPSARGVLIASVIAALACISDAAHAGQTDPTLMIHRALHADGGGATVIRVEASFPWAALLQSGYPVEVVVWATEGHPDFTRIQLTGDSVSGAASFVQDGLSPAEINALHSASSTAAANTISHVSKGRIDVQVRSPLAGRALALQLVVVDDGTPFVSNVVDAGDLP